MCRQRDSQLTRTRRQCGVQYDYLVFETHMSESEQKARPGVQVIKITRTLQRPEAESCWGEPLGLRRRQSSEDPFSELIAPNTELLYDSLSGVRDTPNWLWTSLRELLTSQYSQSFSGTKLSPGRQSSAPRPCRRSFTPCSFTIRCPLTRRPRRTGARPAFRKLRRR